jgi:hypothetical protein
VVGNAVYPAINSVLGEQLAGKITGMIIDENAVNIQMLLSDQSYFNKNVNDAYVLLSGHQQPLMQAPQGFDQQQPFAQQDPINQQQNH